MALPARYRLRDADELRIVVRMKPAASAGFMTLSCRPAPLGVRFAIVVPSKVVALAAERNEIRRRISGALEPLMARCRDGVRGVLVVRSRAVPRGDELRMQVETLFLKAELLKL